MNRYAVVAFRLTPTGATWPVSIAYYSAPDIHAAWREFREQEKAGKLWITPQSSDNFQIYDTATHKLWSGQIVPIK